MPGRYKGRGHGRGHGKGHGNKGGRTTGKSPASKPTTAKGACAELGSHVFDYGSKGAADQMAATWEQIIIYVGTKFSEDITNAPRTKKEQTIPKPQIPPSVMQAHQAKLVATQARTQRMIAANRIAETELQADLAADKTAGESKAQFAIQLAEVQNKIEELEELINNPPEPVLEGEEKVIYAAAWKTYNYRIAKYDDHSNQVFSLMLGQCTQVLKDKMKHDPDYVTVMDNHKPLELRQLIAKTILAQSDDQFCCKTIHEQSCSILGFQQGNFTIEDYFEKFNTRIDVSQTVGVRQVHPAAVKAMTKELYTGQEFEDLPPDRQAEVGEASAEIYYSYLTLVATVSIPSSR